MGYLSDIIGNNYSLPSSIDNDGCVCVINDEIRIELSSGNYIMDHNILFHNYNVVIKGEGTDKTRLIIPRNMNCTGNGWIGLEGQPCKEISVIITNLSIEYDDSLYANGVLAEDSSFITRESAVIKIKCLKSLLIRNVNITVHHLPTTCIDIHKGRNIEIRENLFANYNCCDTGGCIWLRGEMKNVIIEQNDFYKYGNDEVIAIFDHKYACTDESLNRKNIGIRYNRFYCQNETGGFLSDQELEQTDWDGCIKRFISIITNQADGEEVIYSIINGIHIDCNEFYINAPMSYLITTAIDKYTVFKDITINNNIIQYGCWTVDNITNVNGGLTIGDFNIVFDTQFDTEYIDVYDSNSIEPVIISGNTIICGSNMRERETPESPYEDKHICLDVNGAKVTFSHNYILCSRETYTTDEEHFAKKGINLIRCINKSCEIVFNDNHCEGLKQLAFLKGQAGTDDAIMRITGAGNFVQGDIRITQQLFCVDGTKNEYKSFTKSHLFLSDNDLICDYPIIFMNEFADSGTAMFTRNRIYRDLSRVPSETNASGLIFFSSLSEQESNISSMKLDCCDNIFENLHFYNGNSLTSIYSDLTRLTNIRINAKHSDNIFKDYVEYCE